MSKTKEFDRIATKCAEEIIKDIYRECDWALTGDVGDQLLEDKVDFNEAHSYLMRLVASKVANKLLIEEL
jgi:hypothetical protein